MTVIHWSQEHGDWSRGQEGGGIGGHEGDWSGGCSVGLEWGLEWGAGLGGRRGLEYGDCINLPLLTETTPANKMTTAFKSQCITLDSGVWELG